jgi:hypothetical protein
MSPLPAYSPSPVASSSKVTLDGIQPCRPLDAPAGYLPHLVRSVAALKPTKSSVALCLAEDTVFVRPRRRFDDLDWSCGGQPKEGSGGVSRTRWSVSGPAERKVDRLTVPSLRPCSGASSRSCRLRAGRSTTSPSRSRPRAGSPCRAGHPSRTSPLSARSRSPTWPSSSASSSSRASTRASCVSLLSSSSLDNPTLMPPVIRPRLASPPCSFEFSLRVPNSCPASIAPSPFGGLRHVLSAHVVGSGSLLKADLVASQEVFVVHLPDRIDGPGTRPLCRPLSVLRRDRSQG